MVMEFHGMMDTDTKENGKKEREMEKELYSMILETFSRAGGSGALNMAEEYSELGNAK